MRGLVQRKVSSALTALVFNSKWIDLYIKGDRMGGWFAPAVLTENAPFMKQEGCISSVCLRDFLLHEESFFLYSVDVIINKQLQYSFLTA